MFFRTINYFVAAILPAVLLLAAATQPAEARRGIGIGAGIAVGGALLLLNEAARGKARRSRKKRRSKSKRRGVKRSTVRRQDTDLEELNRARRLRENAAAQAARARAIERSERAERGRNVDKAVRRFIAELERLHKRLRGSRTNVRASRSSDINQVTAGEVLRLVDDTYRSTDTSLAQFDRFAGELWTRDRLKVELLSEARRGLPPYFDGVGAKGPSMSDLQVVFQKAGVQVYSRAVELSEIVGVSHSFDRFIRTISENSDRVPASLHTVGADSRYEALLPRAMSTIDSSLLVKTSNVPAADRAGLNSRFQFRFRARRALYDCLSANYVEIATGQAPKEKSNEMGLVQINKIGLASSTNRGAALDLPSDQAEQQPRSQAGAASDTHEVLRRMRDQVQEKCGRYMAALYEDVRNGNFRPHRARADMIQVLDGHTGGRNNLLQPVQTRQGPVTPYSDSPGPAPR